MAILKRTLNQASSAWKLRLGQTFAMPPPDLNCILNLWAKLKRRVHQRRVHYLERFCKKNSLRCPANMLQKKAVLFYRQMKVVQDIKCTGVNNCGVCSS